MPQLRRLYRKSRRVGLFAKELRGSFSLRTRIYYLAVKGNHPFFRKRLELWIVFATDAPRRVDKMKDESWQGRGYFLSVERPREDFPIGEKSGKKRSYLNSCWELRGTRTRYRFRKGTQPKASPCSVNSRSAFSRRTPQFKTAFKVSVWELLAVEPPTLRSWWLMVR